MSVNVRCIKKDERTNRMSCKISNVNGSFEKEQIFDTVILDLENKLCNVSAVYRSRANTNFISADDVFCFESRNPADGRILACYGTKDEMHDIAAGEIYADIVEFYE